MFLLEDRILCSGDVEILQKNIIRKDVSTMILSDILVEAQNTQKQTGNVPIKNILYVTNYEEYAGDSGKIVHSEEGRRIHVPRIILAYDINPDEFHGNISKKTRIPKNTRPQKPGDDKDSGGIN